MAAPPERNPFFRGRETELDQLRQRLVTEQRVNLVGPVGVGRTELAIEYAHRERSSYPAGVFWLRGETEATLRCDLAGMASLPELLLEERHLRVQPRVIEAVTAWLRAHEGWLLVVDDLGESGLPTLAGLSARDLNGHLLVISGQPLSAAPLQVEAMQAVEGSTRLAHIESFELVERADPAAAFILRLCAFLAPDDIPTGLLMNAGREPPSDLWSVLGDEAALERAVTVLERCSLAGRQADGFRVHRQLQLLVRESLGPDSQRWQAAAIRLLRASFPDDVEDAEKWSLCARLLPHVECALHDVGDHQILEPEATSWLLDQVARYLEVRAEFRLAAAFSSRALAIREKVQGPEHPDTAASLNNLGRLLRSLGDLAAARPLLERALFIRQKVRGSEDADTATSLNDLGRLCRAEGDFAAGLPLLERAVAIRERVLGPDHLDTASCLNNLGLLHKSQGELDLARPYLERALAIRERRLGREHPRAVRSRRRLEELAKQLERSQAAG